LEKVESELLATTGTAIQKKHPPSMLVIEQSTSSQGQQQQQRKAIDVFGKQIEPICNYRTCHHKFSAHGHHNCKCRHPINYAAGVSFAVN